MSNDFNNVNPYQSAPVNTGVVTPTETKPASMVVFGILNLVFGAFGLLAIAGAILTLFLDLPQDPNNPIQQAMENPTYKVLNVVMQVVAVALGVVLLISGIGLINGKLYGRRYAIWYAIAALIFLVIGSVVNIVFITLPAFAHAGELPDGPEKVAAIVGGSAILTQPICGVIYPVLLLIFMMRAPVKNYLKIQ